MEQKNVCGILPILIIKIAWDKIKRNAKKLVSSSINYRNIISLFNKNIQRQKHDRYSENIL